jgi:hypothetical protein
MSGKQNLPSATQNGYGFASGSHQPVDIWTILVALKNTKKHLLVSEE